MDNVLEHKFELYPFDDFIMLLDHEIHRSRRYREPLTLIHLVIETNSDHPEAQHSAEVFVIDALNIHLRDTDIPCKKGNEFLVLMPSTDKQGGHIVCQRLQTLFQTESWVYDMVSFKLSSFIGMATLPGDRSISSTKLMQQASQALEHARANRITNTVIYSEMKS